MKNSWRALWAALLWVQAGQAGPPLTTIQDVIYKADGTHFSGTVTISWNGFEAPDTSEIGTHMLTVKVTDGNLRVKLVPTLAADPAVYYTAVYNSDGHVQFTETWAVPASPLPLRLRDVRVSTPAAGTPVSPIRQSDVAGLRADLDLRPMKDASFAAGRVTVVNASGTGLGSVRGNPGDCVHADGSTAPCGGGGKTWADLMTTTWDSLR